MISGSMSETLSRSRVQDQSPPRWRRFSNGDPALPEPLDVVQVIVFADEKLTVVA
ncbi:hypothetical protein [Sphingomonas sp. VNH70]|uniref:hypothetical protein n=1 Tax=Sphingomonas silueang TaxID=3156617 RepID=UPI0032B4C194